MLLLESEGMILEEALNTESEIFRLVYVSHARNQLDVGEIRDIEFTSQRNNAHAGITGILLYKRGRFMQFLEGPESEVRRIFSTIKNDPRHGNITVISEGMIPARQFPNWSMRYTPLSEIQHQFGAIHKKLFDISSAASDVIKNSAEETMRMLFSFKLSDSRY